MRVLSRTQQQFLIPCGYPSRHKRTEASLTKQKSGGEALEK
ncbi:MAG: hypothetical protein QXN05_00080 [Acidilobaceae archaeon]